MLAYPVIQQEEPSRFVDDSVNLDLAVTKKPPLVPLDSERTQRLRIIKLKPASDLTATVKRIFQQSPKLQANKVKSVKPAIVKPKMP